MTTQSPVLAIRSVETASGKIAYGEAGAGPVALFVHGVLMNKHLWRHQLAKLGDIRRCVAPDLMAHGDTEIAPDQDVSVTTNAHMLRDLVGNDSGGGICQIFAALNPERVRTLTLTNCDTHDNWPPEAFKGFVDMVRAGGLKDTLTAMLADKAVYRSPEGLVSVTRIPNPSPTRISKPTCARSCAPHSGPRTFRGSSPRSTIAIRSPSNQSCAR